MRRPIFARGQFVAIACLASFLAAITACETSESELDLEHTTTPNASTDTATSDSSEVGTQSDNSTNSDSTATSTETSCVARQSPDHTYACVLSAEDLTALASDRAGAIALKFLLRHYHAAQPHELFFLDSAFYNLHDEWYSYRIVNNLAVSEDPEQSPLQPGIFANSMADVYDWAITQSTLPAGLIWAGDRLYAPRFYERAFGAMRSFVPGVLIRFPGANGQPARWAFELGYGDQISYEQLRDVFVDLDTHLPADIAGHFSWITRSPEQEVIAESFRAASLPYSERIISYDDVLGEQTAFVYQPGLSAGKLRFLWSTDSKLGSKDEDIVVTNFVPDELPPGRALLTSLPQTPLSHINILAATRGIPNVYMPNAARDPFLDQLGRAGRPVAIQATADHRVNIIEITPDELRTWESLQTPSLPELQHIDGSTLAYGIDLRQHTIMLPEVAHFGGKVQGMARLLSQSELAIPYAPYALSIRAYQEVLAQHRATIEAALQLQEFQHPANLPLRHLVLEGETSFRDHFTGAAAARLLAEMKTRVPGDILGDLVRANGLRELIEDSDVSVEVAQELQTIVAQHFDGLPDSTAFRARSSSSVEDIEGFSGAGLYDSNTFYLHPDLAPAEDKKKHLLRALKKTWASYWSAEAFEERRRAGIDHLAGNMAILIHPRFDDPLERANAVATFSRRRIDGVTHDLLEVNVQAGAVSVTNPDGSALPEVDQVSLGGNTLTPSIGRIQSSTLAGANKAIWSDAQLLDIFSKSQVIADKFNQDRNRTLAATQAATSVVLDLELREMDASWQANSPVTPAGAPSQIIFKQVRSLDPGAQTGVQTIEDEPIPVDVLVRLTQAMETTCQLRQATQANASLEVTWLGALTDDSRKPDLGYATQPMVIRLALVAKAPIDSLALGLGQRVNFDHTTASCERVESGLNCQLIDVAHVPLRGAQLTLDAANWRLQAGEVALTGSTEGCTSIIRYASAADYLLQIINASSPQRESRSFHGPYREQR